MCELSDDERAMLPSVKREKLLYELDATIKASGLELNVTLSVYGRYHPYYPGDSGGKGERRISPEEPAHYEITDVTIGSGPGETDITAALSEKDLDNLAAKAMEERNGE